MLYVVCFLCPTYRRFFTRGRMCTYVLRKAKGVTSESEVVTVRVTRGLESSRTRGKG